MQRYWEKDKSSALAGCFNSLNLCVLTEKMVLINTDQRDKYILTIFIDLSLSKHPLRRANTSKFLPHHTCCLFPFPRELESTFVNFPNLCSTIPVHLHLRQKLYFYLIFMSCSKNRHTLLPFTGYIR